MRRLLFAWISLPLLWPQLSLDLKPEALFRLHWGSTGNLGTAGLSLQASTTAARFTLQGKGAVWVDLEPQADLLEGYLDARLEPYRVVVGKWARYGNPEDLTPFGPEGAWGVYGSYALAEPVGHLSLEAAYLWGGRVYLGGRSGGFSAGAFLGGSGFTPRLGLEGVYGGLYWQGDRGVFGHGRWAVSPQDALEGSFWWNPGRKLLLGLAYSYADGVRLGLDASFQPLGAYRVWLEVWGR
ncbi:MULTISPECIES: hypothetical protein [unclassified Meiothermus]|uniref:hypothetical protein n=1 Tax=unclassified Meiothermus TaxID=370471 RepID=UPI000D7BA389|nr:MULTISPECIES: hypothetical protein [unclassified Meiothermus]PZA06804.1 hypothetical protein DNA98_11350 [Meiothermus sp. Pnk-1]RYM33085.1 hypothetical protein EWH23_13675 [Meiothermus sp. PNK-Is4]